MSEMMSCPFCGEQPVEIPVHKSYEVANYRDYVRCENLDCPMSGLSFKKAAWNTRAPTSSEPAKP